MKTGHVKYKKKQVYTSTRYKQLYKYNEHNKLINVITDHRMIATSV